MPTPFAEDIFCFPLYNFRFFVKNQVFICVWINIRVFNLIPLVNFSVFMSILSCFHYCGSVIELDIRDGETSVSSLLYRIVLVILGSFVFPYEIDYCSFKVCEELCWDFDGD